MIPDTGERYLSTPLFEDIAETMTDEELDISASTPGYRFDVSAAAAPAAATAVEAKAEAVEFVNTALADRDNPVVIFALEWCEFCWSVRKLFAELNIPYKSVDLDSVAYQKDNLGGEIRAVLRQKLGSPTIPQIFVGGEYVGGCSETFDALTDGSFQALLRKYDVSFDNEKSVDPYSFLPKWLHPR